MGYCDFAGSSDSEVGSCRRRAADGAEVGRASRQDRERPSNQVVDCSRSVWPNVRSGERAAIGRGVVKCRKRLGQWKVSGRRI